MIDVSNKMHYSPTIWKKFKIKIGGCKSSWKRKNLGQVGKFNNWRKTINSKLIE